MKKRLTNAHEVLFRQIHPKFIENGEPSSDRFRPSAQDQNMLSLDRSALITASEAHAQYVATGKQSAAVFGVSVAEFAKESLTCVEDPIPVKETTPANPAHCLADYSPHALKDQKLIAKRLKRVAIARGRLHPPE
ncbi:MULTISPECIES: hypothetical protein [unclassified Bradyrhizobium]|uniref:hypothetical protein n=1 Tax=unclassified Bradyrhizobium TaxID=2631580 RepID=UPI00211E6459|nr:MULTISPECIES: hypothetical protein [unclassified Bradyrhizobium]MDD1536094.1 hypothetical protein [Bradyrhizobium sp. WBOS8]MDD1585664.1 hypothetical protein [Bradyrhizobium sp. WBOS4]UUO49056.1 hypothetical protein DCM78_20350 [Bradyrhizobium sp. WBOS04]UUO62871.1 hypothetical protein DCM80_29225 [Bradyrhizobium sp. WBOS08]